MVTIPRPIHGARWSVTVARRTPRGTVTVPVAWLTVPVEEVAMLRTKDGSWKRTGPLGGPPRPTTSEPFDRCATRESSRTLSAPAMPQACGDEPWPVDGCRPTQRDWGSGALELSHHDHGPL